MYPSVNLTDIDIFNKPARVIVAGYSGCGKSYLVSELVKLYHAKFQKIVVYGTALEGLQDISIVRGGDENPLDDDSFGQKLVIFDDCIYNRTLMKIAGEVFIRGRHLNISSIFITQNIFLADKEFRAISLNATHITLLRHRDMKQILCFARSFLTEEKVKKFLDLYKKVVIKEPYSHILIDFTKDIEAPLMLRSGIASATTYEKTYLL